MLCQGETVMQPNQNILSSPEKRRNLCNSHHVFWTFLKTEVIVKRNWLRKSTGYLNKIKSHVDTYCL